MPESPHAEVVYVLGTPGSNTVKIGRTTNLPRRLADIQRMSPVPLTVLWTHPGGSELEANLHRHFKAIRSHGEWFNFADAPVDLIRKAVAEKPWRPSRKLAQRRAVTDLKPRQLRLPESHPATVDLAAAFTEELARLQAISDPVARVKAVLERRAQIAEADRQIMDHQRDSILGLRAEGRTWRSIGAAFGFSGSHAEAFVSRRKAK